MCCLSDTVKTVDRGKVFRVWVCVWVFGTQIALYFVVVVVVVVVSFIIIHFYLERCPRLASVNESSFYTKCWHEFKMASPSFVH